MGEEVRLTGYDVVGGGGNDEARVSEWEVGLPSVDDLTPLSQSLFSAELLSAFSITPDPCRSMIDVNCASQTTLSNLRGEFEQQSLTNFKSFDKGDETVAEDEETADLIREIPNLRKSQRLEIDDDVDGGGSEEEADDSSGRTSKRRRVVWTPPLHKRFIEVIGHLGLKNAVPKTIMQLMNVEGLRRENVASHLQKYRLYLKRMNTSSSPDHHSPSTTPVSQNLLGSGGGNGYRDSLAAIPMSYHPQMVHNSSGGGGGAYHHGFESDSYPYNLTTHLRYWSGNNNN